MPNKMSLVSIAPRGSKSDAGYPGFCLSAMLQDVDQVSERIADVEARHPPRLSHRTIFDHEPCRPHPPVNSTRKSKRSPQNR
jgi:hypothetical protein